MRSKLRKGSLSKADESTLSVLMLSQHSGNSSAASFSNTTNGTKEHAMSNGNTSSTSGGGTVAGAGVNSASSSSSRKSLISNPTNFQHLHHMGPSDGKMLMQVEPVPVQKVTHQISPATLTNLPTLGLFDKKLAFISLH